VSERCAEVPWAVQARERTRPRDRRATIFVLHRRRRNHPLKITRKAKSKKRHAGHPFRPNASPAEIRAISAPFEGPQRVLEAVSG
jgi:hypothetical protein